MTFIHYLHIRFAGIKIGNLKVWCTSRSKRRGYNIGALLVDKNNLPVKIWIKLHKLNW